MAVKSNKKVTGVKSSTLAMFEGTFMAILGLSIAIMYSLRSVVDIAESTQSVLAGLSFGLAVGVVSMIVVPLVYFGIGYVIGYLHGFVFNVIAETAGGLTFRMEDEK